MALKKMHKGKKERERKDKNRKMTPPVDPETRLDCCNFVVKWSQS